MTAPATPISDTQANAIVTELVEQAYKSRASDIHVERFEQRAGVRLRVDGVLRRVRDLTDDEYAAVCARIKVMAGMDATERRLPQDGRIHWPTGLDLRVSTFPCTFGESIVIRLLDSKSVVLDLPRCGFNEAQMRIVTHWLSRPNGVILVTGPTGSGKTTVLYAMLHALNREEHKVCSIEDPVEYVFEGVNQLAVNPRAGLTFAAALRAVLRQDPDVIMIGEIRDRETAMAIIQAALTGHLVLSCVHTNDSTSSLVRLRDIGLEAFLIKDAVVGVSAQRLVRKLCPKCREAYEPDAVCRQALGLPAGQFYRARGCADCRGTGYRGRIAIFELLAPGESVKSLLLQGADAAELRRAALAEGLVTLWADGLAKAAAGITSLEEVQRVVGSRG